MKNSIVIVMIVLTIVFVIGIGINKLTGMTTTESVYSHAVTEYMVKLEGLKEEEGLALDEVLNQCDKLIQLSLEEAIEKGQTDKQTAKKRFEHLQRTSLVALNLLEAYQTAQNVVFTREEVEDLILAAYLHDIRKYDEGDHAENGAEYIRENLQVYVGEYMALSDGRLERIATLIEYHNTKLKEKVQKKLGDNLVLVQLIQDADATDKILYQGKDIIDELQLSSSKDYVAHAK